MHTLRLTRLTLVVASVALLAACSSAAAPPSAAVSVTDAWARSSSAMASAAAAYATIANAGPTADALVGASSPAAAAVEVHETVAMGSPAASGSGMMGMRPVARVEIAAGGSLQLKPGSYHVMLIGLARDLAVGDTIDLTLTFEKAGQITVKAQVRAS